MLATNVVDDWYWVDAVQMAMPIFAQLGTIEKDERYFRRMYEMYMFTRNRHGGSKKSGGLPLFNTEDGLWLRDYNYDPPYMDLKETDKPTIGREEMVGYIWLLRVCCIILPIR